MLFIIFFIHIISEKYAIKITNYNLKKFIIGILAKENEPFMKINEK